VAAVSLALVAYEAIGRREYRVQIRHPNIEG
jgi:hypothetical protein